MYSASTDICRCIALQGGAVNRQPHYGPTFWVANIANCDWNPIERANGLGSAEVGHDQYVVNGADHNDMKQLLRTLRRALWFLSCNARTIDRGCSP